VAREAVSADRPFAWLKEEERQEDGRTATGITVFLVNRECPWRCAMCDLWRYTLTVQAPAGSIPRQIDVAFQKAGIEGLEWVKLYNAGSFFDNGAIPASDLPAIAGLCRGFSRVIVECHPSLVGASLVRFHDLLGPRTRLEVAMGLETAHPVALEQLNKRFDLAGFRRAARFIRENDCDLRVFLLARPPFVPVAEVESWLERSIDFALDCGADPVVIIPTRLGNGAMERLVALGLHSPPTLSLLEHGMRFGLGRQRGRVFVDLWDVERMVGPDAGMSARCEALERMNAIQGDGLALATPGGFGRA
jgi:archaeosine synthase beta-subunit